MINQRRAFNRYTTTNVLFAEPIGGYWDADNQWVVNAMGPVVSIKATPIPYGNRDEGVFGEQLKANPELERIPAFMGFHSTHILPINSLVCVYGTTYLITQHGHYDDMGFSKVIGSKVQNLVLTEGDPLKEAFEKMIEEYIANNGKKSKKKKDTLDVAGWS